MTCTTCGGGPIAETPRALTDSLTRNAATVSTSHGIKAMSQRGTNGVPGQWLKMKSDKALAWARSDVEVKAADLPAKVESKVWVNVACNSLVVDDQGRVGGALAEKFIESGGQAYIGIVGSPSGFAGDKYATDAQKLLRENPDLTGNEVAERLTANAWKRGDWRADRTARLQSEAAEASVGMGPRPGAALKPADAPQFFCYGPSCDLPMSKVHKGETGQEQRTGDRPYPGW